MKLDEIIQTRIHAARSKKPRLSDLKYGGDLPSKTIGTGYYSNVLQTNDPHLVAKVPMYPSVLDRDAYFHYISYVVDDNLASENPWFPRIYDIVLVDTALKTELVHYNIKMEKLLTRSDCSPEEMNVLVKNTVNLAYYHPEEEDKRLDMNGYLVDVCRYALKFGDFTRIKDQALIDALKVIKTVMQEGNYTSDIGGSNIMYRRIPTGIQGVLTDPLS